MANIAIGAITTGVQTVTATGAIVPTTGLDISGITGDWTAYIDVTNLTAGKKAKIQLETSIDATNWIAVFVVDVQGAVTKVADKTYSVRKYQRPSAPFGVSAGFARLNVTFIDAAASLSVRGWLQS